MKPVNLLAGFFYCGDKKEYDLSLLSYLSDISIK